MFKNLVLQMHRELIPSAGGGQGTELETPPESQDSNSQQPTTNQNQNPPVPLIDAEYVKRLEDTIKQNNELSARNAEIMRRMEERLNASPTPTATPAPEVKKTAEELNKEYYDNPGTFVENRIEQALKRTVQPLNDFVANFRSNEQVDRLVTDLKQNPRFASQWDANVEDAVRKQLGAVPAANLNLGLAQQAAVNAIGLKTLGAFGTPSPNPVPNPAPSNPESTVTIPPNVRPSNPPAPNSRPTKQAPVLTENERRLARENKQTPEEFVFWRDLPADKVMTAKWDKAKNEGTY